MADDPDLVTYKNIAPYAVDIGGRMVAPGEVVDLSPHRRVVDYHADRGVLVAVNTEPAQPPAAPDVPPEPQSKPAKSRTAKAEES